MLQTGFGAYCSLVIVALSVRPLCVSALGIGIQFYSFLYVQHIIGAE